MQAVGVNISWHIFRGVAAKMFRSYAHGLPLVIGLHASHHNDSHGPLTKYCDRLLRSLPRASVEMVDTDDVVIGGAGIVVQVDETKIGKRKYHRGHRVDGAWDVVGVEKTPTRLVFAEVVADRSAATIEGVLYRHIAAGSIVQTDCWRGYSGVAGGLGLEHHTVNHSDWFRDPTTGVETNTVEGTNFAIKRSIPIRNRTEGFISLIYWSLCGGGEMKASCGIALLQL